MRRRFITVPHDEYTVQLHQGIISDCLEVSVANSETGEAFPLTFKNTKEAWEELKTISSIPSRSVFVEIVNWDGTVKKSRLEEWE